MEFGRSAFLAEAFWLFRHTNANSPEAIRVRSFGMRILAFFEPGRALRIAGRGRRPESALYLYALKFLLAGLATMRYVNGMFV